MNELSTATLDEFMHTECTYGDEYEDTKNHPHREYWCCEKCLAKKLSDLQSSNKEIEEKLRVAKEFLEKIRFKCLGDNGGKCYCDEHEAVLAFLGV